ncbi:MAG: Rne/Rng family ribonuclease [Bacteroidetes bacterium]|nr:Rne/Rng family ribonuclease [Bacteroidota bacterium]MCY4206237.1 Rne/Rng family ribonuclease [Bacteroidota bacterium]
MLRRPPSIQPSPASLAEVTGFVVVGMRQAYPKLHYMSKEIIINTTPKETRIAIVDQGKLVEFYIESPENERTVGDIFLGRIVTFRSGLRAAFVDIGEEQQGFLHFSDLASNLEQQLAFVEESKPHVARFMRTWLSKHPEASSQKDSSRRRWGDSNLLKSKQKILVTITKEPYHSKSPRLSTDISLAGRFLVLIPLAEYGAVSKRIESRKERNRLRSIVKKIRPAGFGLIARTVAEGRDEEALEKDLQLLMDRWENIEKSLQGSQDAPKKLHEDVNLASSIIRDLFSDDFTRVLVDNHRMYRAIRGYVLAVAPHMIHAVKEHKGNHPIFAAAGIEDQISEVFDTQVGLPSGGSLIIEATEAMHVIDVNSGRTRTKKDAESQALKVNLEAVGEIARQIRLRDLSGLIVVDFIDLRFESNRKKVDDTLTTALQADRVQSQNFPMSELGIVQIARERKRVSVTSTHRLARKSRINRVPPPNPDFIARKIERWLEKHDGGSLHLQVHPLTAAWILRGGWFRSRKAKWQRQYKHRIRVVETESLTPDEFRFLDAKSEHDITDLSPRMVRIKAQAKQNSSKKSSPTTKKKDQSGSQRDQNGQAPGKPKRRRPQKTAVNA